MHKVEKIANLYIYNLKHNFDLFHSGFSFSGPRGHGNVDFFIKTDLKIPYEESFLTGMRIGPDEGMKAIQDFINKNDGFVLINE